MVDGVSYHADGCECWACLSDMDVGCVPLMVICKYISAEEDEEIRGG